MSRKAELDLYVQSINSIPLLTREQEFAYATRYSKKKDMKAREVLINSNLRFVVKVAHEYKGYGLPLIDIVQEGNIGLMRAVDKFNPKRGFRVITYAVWWIKAYIQNYILRNWSVVKVGTTQGQRVLFYKLKALQNKLGPFEDTNYAKIAEELKVSEREAAEMDLRMRNKDLSLNRPIDEASGSPTTDLDVLPDLGMLPDEIVAERQNQDALRQSLHEIIEGTDSLGKPFFSEKCKYVIYNRLMTDEKFTLREIGDALHISRERARQIQEQATRLLKQKLVMRYPFLLSNLDKKLESISKDRKRRQHKNSMLTIYRENARVRKETEETELIPS